MQNESSTDLDTLNIFVKNSHLLAKLQSVIKELIHLTSSKYKETTLGARKKHDKETCRKTCGGTRSIQFRTSKKDKIWSFTQ